MSLSSNDRNKVINNNEHISVCVCTFKRPVLLTRLLCELECQKTEGLFDFSVVIVDNDYLESAKIAVTEYAKKTSMKITYCTEHRQNIALARNKALELAKGKYIAFIDDDEFPVKDWLYCLYNSIYNSDVSGVLGPVVPYFENEPEGWIRLGKFFERPTHNTGYKIDMTDARAGNVLFKRYILDNEKEPFLPKFGTGGEDVDFFRRMFNKGCVFVWCNEAIAYELVPTTRCNGRYLLKRAMLRGKNFSFKRLSAIPHIIKSLIAIPVYSLALPFLFIAGKHHLMNYLIKLCDHSGRILALFGLNPVKEREL